MAIQIAVVSGSVFAVITVLLTLCSAINLNQPTPKPKHIKLIPSTASPGGVGEAQSTPKQDDSGVAVYRFINSHTGTTCILMKTDAVVEIKFKLNNLEEQADSFIPERALLESNCQNEDLASLRISWTGYSLVMTFAKYPGGEKWYISNVELTVSPDLPQLRGIPVKDKSAIRLYHRTILIPTPVGKAFECDELDVDLEPAPDDKSTPPGVRGSLLLRLIKIQPFMYKGEDFSDAVHCRKGQSSFRDETTSIAVGSTLAVAVIAIIIGYSAYKYFRVKNVQYNTME